MTNKIATNGIYNHLKHNRKHKVAWDDAVYIHQGVQTNICWNEFNSEVQKSLKKLENCGRHFLEMGMYFHLNVVSYFIFLSKKSLLMKI